LDKDARYLTVPSGLQVVVAGRYLVTGGGGVIDLREKRVLNTERFGEFIWWDEKKVIYSVDEFNRVQGRFTFEYATETLTRIGDAHKVEWAMQVRIRMDVSPDRKKAIEWRNYDELVLHREGEKPKSLGKGFTMKVESEFHKKLVVEGDIGIPLLWLDDERFLTQRENGKLVTVDLAGNVAEVVTVKGVPQSAISELSRDRAGAVIYFARGQRYAIDLSKKTAEKSEWAGLGHGFEVSWDSDRNKRYKLRHNGKDIGQFPCDPGTVQTAPGYLAICQDGSPQFAVVHPRGDIVVWSAASSEWTTLKYQHLGQTPIAGWIK
jgi:hypothetical protein